MSTVTTSFKKWVGKSLVRKAVITPGVGGESALLPGKILIFDILNLKGMVKPKTSYGTRALTRKSSLVTCRGYANAFAQLYTHIRKEKKLERENPDTGWFMCSVSYLLNWKQTIRNHMGMFLENFAKENFHLLLFISLLGFFFSSFSLPSSFLSSSPYLAASFCSFFIHLLSLPFDVPFHTLIHSIFLLYHS